MPAKSEVTANARKRARDQLTAKNAAAREREKANEDDLTAIFALDGDLDGAAHTRDQAIAAAAAAYDAAVAATTHAQHQKVRAILARGETAAEVADLTGWTVKQVRAAAKAAPPETTDQAGPPADVDS